MSENSNQTNQNQWMGLLRVIGFLLCFIVPSAALAWFFRNPVILLVGCGLMSPVSGLILGLMWYNRELNTQTKSVVTAWLPALLLGFGMRYVIESIQENTWFDMVSYLKFTAALVAATYIPFFIGKAIAKRRVLSRENSNA